MSSTPTRPRVVIIGSGFGGLFAAKALAKAPVDVTVIGRTTHHLFQPLLYQVATGILSEGEIAPATREVLSRQDNARVIIGDVERIDLATRTVHSSILGRSSVTSYDHLIVAAGAGQSYFGNDHFAQFAPGMKSIDDALELRGRIFGAFEIAELEAAQAADSSGTVSAEAAESVNRWLTFVVVGAGPTGVEMAGQIAELAHRTLRKDFRRIDTRTAKILLLDGAPRVLPSFTPKLSEYARRKLTSMGVDVELSTQVVDVDEQGLQVKESDGSLRYIPTMVKIWAAGVAGSPLGRQLAEQCGAEVDRAGRVRVQPDCTLPGHPEVFVVGDMMALDNLPGVAQVAMQSAQYSARAIVRQLEGKPAQPPFSYHDKGSMATISRFAAVASVGKLQLTGVLAWVAWLAVHLVYLIGFKNRLTTLLHWAVSFVGRGRSERTTTVQQVVARRALQLQAELERLQEDGRS